jgi:von Willebrand factor type A domain
MRFRLRVRRALLMGLIFAGPAAACGSKGSGLTGVADTAGNGSGSSAASGSGGGSGGGSSSGGASSGGSGLFKSSDGGAAMTTLLTPDAACAFSTQMGQQQALNAYMMLDYSASMQMNGKWTGITNAINSFVQQPTSGISVGLQYFAQVAPPPDGGAIAGLFCLIPSLCDSCDPAAYAMPAIEIAPLPGVASQITASLAAHTTPNTATPTGPALQGAIDHATTWTNAHPSDVTVVILATDGDPSECGSATSTASLLSQVETIAAAGVAATPKILTFVIGVGTETANLNGIAQAGGTGSAFIVDTSMNVSTQFLAALNKIRGAALGCQYKIPVPDSGTIDTALVNVQFTPTGGKSELVPQVANKGVCPASGNAWYYDNPSNPTEILLCTTTCGTVATGGRVDVLTGCQTVVAPPTR